MDERTLSEHDRLIVHLVTIESLLRTVAESLADLAVKLAPASLPAPSSAEVKTSQRGVDIAVKSYVGSDVAPAVDQAVAEYQRALDLVASARARQPA